MINIDFLEQKYFCFDEPVPYHTENGDIFIHPILLKDSILFLPSLNVIMEDKNASSNIDIIQMSYLQFIIDVLFKEDKNNFFSQSMFIILSKSLRMQNPIIYKNKDGTPFIFDKDTNQKINHEEFEDIRKIILYQNLLHYDDTYIDPELKKNMQEQDALQNKKFDSPSLERKISIISSHCGILKQEQINMTYRYHCSLWEEVCGEIEFTTTRPRPVGLFNGNDTEHWIFKNKRNKYQEYIKSIDEFAQNMGGGSIKTSTANIGDNLMQQFNEFNKN